LDRLAVNEIIALMASCMVMSQKQHLQLKNQLRAHLNHVSLSQEILALQRLSGHKDQGLLKTLERTLTSRNTDKRHAVVARCVMGMSLTSPLMVVPLSLPLSR
jgi:hypothetical protein